MEKYLAAKHLHKISAGAINVRCILNRRILIYDNSKQTTIKKTKQRQHGFSLLLPVHSLTYSPIHSIRSHCHLFAMYVFVRMQFVCQTKLSHSVPIQSYRLIS